MTKWSCGACTFENEPGAAACAMCETPRPQAPIEDKPQAAVASDVLASSFAGQYSDSKYMFFISQEGSSITVRSHPSRPETPATGSAKDGIISVWGLTGSYSADGRILWSNDIAWTPVAAEDGIIGEWFYAKDKCFSILNAKGNLAFKQSVPSGPAEGVLSPDGDWLVADLCLPGGGLFGTIRLRYQSGMMISNFKLPDDIWGEDLTATKTNDDKMVFDASGPIGASYHDITGEITHVIDGSIAQRLGVQVGWRPIHIDGTAFSMDLLLQKATSGKTYRIAFLKRQPVDTRADSSLALAKKLSIASSGGEDISFGKIFSARELREQGVFFEAQEPDSETCAQNALNNLAQHHLFSVEDLGKAEIQHSNSGWGLDLSPDSQSNNSLRTGFFDIEAVKRAAAKEGLHVVDVEPKADYKESELPAFLAGCQEESAEGKSQQWFKGLLVYDSRPGHARHFYAIVARPGRQFILLNSLEEEYGAQNRLLTESELWEMHEYYALDFKSWVFRWYPVVSQQAALTSLQSLLRLDNPSWSISSLRAMRVIHACRWQVAAAATQLLHDDVSAVLQRFRAGQLVIPRSAAQEALDSAGGDAQKAAEKLAEALKLQAACVVPDETVARHALNAAGWSIDNAVSVLELAGTSGSKNFASLNDILERVAWNFDRAVKVKEVIEKHSAKQDEEDSRTQDDAEVKEDIMTSEASTISQLTLDPELATKLLEACNWQVHDVSCVLTVQKSFPQCPLLVIRSVLQRNDGDSSAAVEMLKDFTKRVSGHVLKCVQSSKISNGEFDEIDVVSITEAAIDCGSWNPTAALNHAHHLTEFTLATKALCAAHMPPGSHVPASGIMWALRESNEMSADVAARMLLYGEDPKEASHNVHRRQLRCNPVPVQARKAPDSDGGYAVGAPKSKAKAKSKPRPLPKDEDSSDCSLM